jgi:hypothetical protein
MTIGADCGIHLFFITDIPGKTEKTRIRKFLKIAIKLFILNDRNNCQLLLINTNYKNVVLH